MHVRLNGDSITFCQCCENVPTVLLHWVAWTKSSLRNHQNCGRLATQLNTLASTRSILKGVPFCLITWFHQYRRLTFIWCLISGTTRMREQTHCQAESEQPWCFTIMVNAYRYNIYQASARCCNVRMLLMITVLLSCIHFRSSLGSIWNGAFRMLSKHYTSNTRLKLSMLEDDM